MTTTDKRNARDLSMNINQGEQFVLGQHLYTITELFRSNNSFILYATNGKGDNEVIKIYGETREIPIDQSGKILMNLVSYSERLAADGVSIAPLTQDCLTIQLNNASGRFNIILKTPFLGNSYEQLILVAPGQKECVQLLRNILNSLGRLLPQAKGSRLKHGVDLIPRNFVGTDRHTTYVDLMPPKIFSNGKYLLEWPEVTDALTRRVGIYRHYDKLGIMQVLLVQMCKLRPEFYEAFAKEIFRYLKRIGEPATAQKFRDRYVPNSLTGRNGDRQKISQFTFRRIYDLREAACYYAHLGLMTKKELLDLFNASHFQDKPIPDAVMKRLRGMLIDAINRRTTIETSWNEQMAAALKKLGGKIRKGESLPYALERTSLARLARNFHAEGLRIVIISGPTGVGKSYVANGLEENGFSRIPNVFTREIRPGERHGIDFIHMNEEQFLAAKHDGAFLVTNKRHGYYHGLLKRLLEGANSSPGVSYMDKSVPSTIQLLGNSAIRCLTVYVLPPDPGELLRRITERSHRIGHSRNEDITERLDTSLAEFPASVDVYNLFVVHEIDTTRVVDKICEVLNFA